jgi:hypothetical protein
MTLKLLLPTLIFLCVACGKAPSTGRSSVTSNNADTSPTSSRVHDAEVHVGFMYWALPTPVLCKEWQLVVGGTVLETHHEKGYGAHAEPFTSGTMTVDKLFLNLPTRKDVVSASAKSFKADVFDGLSIGDKVIVFVSEYDGGYGIIEVPDSNCKIGIKVKGWDDPIVSAVEKMIANGETVNNMRARRDMLEDHAYADLWRPYSSKGIAYLLGGEKYWQ